RLGLLQRARRIATIQNAESDGSARALLHRGILERAKKQALEHVLVIDDAAQLSDRAVAMLDRCVRELRGRAWQFRQVGDAAAGPRAVAYHRNAYDTLLAGGAPAPSDLDEWLTTFGNRERRRPARMPG